MCCLHSSQSPQSPHQNQHLKVARWWRVAFFVALIVPIALYLWTEQRVLLLSLLPYAVLLLCPLLHLFLHRGHGAHAASGDEVEQSSASPPSASPPKPPISSTR